MTANLNNKPIPQGYKRTDIGIIPEDWELKTLDGLTEKIIGGGTPARANSDFWAGEIPWATVKDLTSFSPYKTQEYITQNGLNNSASHLIPANTVIIATRMALGKVVIYQVPVSINQDLKAVFFKKNVSSLFFFHWYLHNAKVIEGLGNGSTVMGISLNDLKAIQIPLPPLPEQQRIAQILSDTDALIQQLDALIAKKQAIKQGTMQELLRPKEGWEVKTLGEVAEVVRGASPRPIDSPIWFKSNSSVGWVRISDITRANKYLSITTQKLSEVGVKNSRFVAKNNLIMSICATVGKPILTKIDVCIHDGFVVFNNLKANNEYIYYYLKFIEDDWAKNGQTGSQMNLNTNLIKITAIPLPELVEQNHIAQILSDMDKELEQLGAKRAKYAAIKTGLMQSLLTGAVRV